MSDLLNWARKEIEIARKKEGNGPGCACYKSALRAFESLCEDHHSGLSIKITQNILNTLLNGQPLTPIEDVDGIWEKCTMPYIPGKPIKVYCEDFLTDKKNGDFDTVGVFYALKTENDKQEKIEINRFFREPENDENDAWVEICKKEYDERKKAAIDRT